MHATRRSAATWFGPPDLPRPDLQRKAKALWIVSWPFFLVVTVILLVDVAFEPETFGRRALTITAVGGLVTILHVISRSGRPELASWILVMGLSAIVTQRAWGVGGIHTQVSLFYALFIVMAGALLGARGGLATAAVCLLGAIFLAVATSLQWLTPKPGGGPIVSAFLTVVLAIGLALLLQMLVVSNPRKARLGPDAAQMLAHDMRTPMQALLGHLEALRGEVRGESAAEVESAIGGVNALNRMTDSFLDAGRLEAGEMPIKRSLTDLAEVARTVVEIFQIIQRRRVMAVEIYGDAICQCDPGLTRRIIENLVSNALKHTDLSGRVTVVVNGAPNTISIIVRDQGDGVPPDQRGLIFEPYFGSGASEAGASYGIGLAFCRLAAEAQGGTIRVEDSPPRGSAFVVELPR